jgi:hypothetical protein
VAERAKHLFRFRASQIAAAAHEEAVYHTHRERFWNDQLLRSTELVEKTASVKVTRQEHTGGWSPVVTVDYGDPAAYKRMIEAGQKVQSHRAAAERFESDERLYSTQFDANEKRDRDYELDADDVAHFRLMGQAREE